jgi:hypothetical protein
LVRPRTTKTVELIVEKKEIKSPLRKKAEDKVVAVRVAYGERKLGMQIRAAGGRWDPDVKLWYVPYGKIKGTELEPHVIFDAGMKSGKNTGI